MVAAKKSGFSVGEQRRREPSDRTSSNWVTCDPKVPAMWWFLPWMSLAMAPPRVTYLVPGVTGRNQPRGTAKSRIWASAHAGFGGEQTGLGVERDQAVHAGGDDEVAFLEQADVAVGAAQADGEDAVVHALGDAGVLALPVKGDEMCGVIRVAAPGLEGRVAEGRG